jgi:hypothetical protein
LLWSYLFFGLEKRKKSVDLNGDYYSNPSRSETSYTIWARCSVNQRLYNIWNYGSQLFIFTGSYSVKDIPSNGFYNIDPGFNISVYVSGWFNVNDIITYPIVSCYSSVNQGIFYMYNSITSRFTYIHFTFSNNSKSDQIIIGSFKSYYY